MTVYPANLPNPNQWNATANPLTAGINVSVKATIYVKRQKANGTWETLEYSTVGTTTVSSGGGSGGEG